MIGVVSTQTILERSDGPVRILGLNRPERRNAVDGPTAQVLADAFRRFDADESASVAVLYGEGGTFCAGADLKAIADGSTVTGWRPTETGRWDRRDCDWASR